MLRAPLIPDYHCARRIPNPAAKIMPAIDMIEQEFQQVVGLVIVISYNILRIRAVDKEILPASDRMHGHHRVHRARYWTADDGCRPIVTKFS
jgi:hypothetical protein